MVEMTEVWKKEAAQLLPDHRDLYWLVGKLAQFTEPRLIAVIVANIERQAEKAFGGESSDWRTVSDPKSAPQREFVSKVLSEATKLLEPKIT